MGMLIKKIYHLSFLSTGVRSKNSYFHNRYTVLMSRLAEIGKKNTFEVVSSCFI